MGKHYSITFNQAPWIRNSYRTGTEERPARIEDLVSKNVAMSWGVGGEDFYEFNEDALGDRQAVWKYEHPQYQELLDIFLVRRKIYWLEAHKACATGSVLMGDIDSLYGAADDLYITEDIPIVCSGIEFLLIPADKWIPYEFTCNDNQNSMSIVTGRWKSYGDWQLIDIPSGSVYG
ncbi:MAG: hypothetical protein WAX69_15310 [Victivallales bacterium]